MTQQEKDTIRQLLYASQGDVLSPYLIEDLLGQIRVEAGNEGEGKESTS